MEKDLFFSISLYSFFLFLEYIYWATKVTPRLSIPILFETEISENIFLIKNEPYNV